MLEVPGYRIEGELGSGGMGAVYRGVLQSTGEAVAIKLLRDHVGDPEGLERFRREAQVLAEFAHLGILSAREFGSSSWTTRSADPGCAASSENQVG